LFVACLIKNIRLPIGGPAVWAGLFGPTPMIHLCLVTHFAIDEVPEVHMPFQKTPSYASDLKYLHKKKHNK